MTTASTHSPRRFADRPLLGVVVAAYAAVWLVTAVSAADRSTWLLENVLPVAAVASLVVAYRRWQLSDLSYVLCALFLAMHALAAAHGYPSVPPGEWLREWAGFGRNHYDRVVHLAFGLLVAYPIRELTMRATGGVHLWASLFALSAVCTLGVLYEVAEWLVAALIAPHAPQLGADFLGAQGDPWDAQKDMALGALGALLSLTLTYCLHRWRYLPPHAPALAQVERADGVEGAKGVEGTAL